MKTPQVINKAVPIINKVLATQETLLKETTKPRTIMPQQTIIKKSKK